MGNEILNNKRWIVYVYTNKTNGKKYVGQTCRSLEIRSGTKGQGYKQCSHFWNAICKYGWDNFEHEILFENLTHEKANKLEKLLIQILRTQNPEYGYNIQNGGNDSSFQPDDIRGQKFGKLTAVMIDKSREDNKHWLCQCDCGNPELVSVSIYSLKNHITTSCGCYRLEVLKNIKFKHGMTHSPLYKIWQKMRCNDIAICDEWNDSFICFYNWSIENNYSEGLHLKRIDFSKGFSPSNCTWSTKQGARHDVTYTYDGKEMTVPDIAKSIGMNPDTLRGRIRRMGFENAITKPLRIAKRYYEYEGISHTINEWANIYNINPKTLACRLSNGKTIKEAIGIM